MPIFWFLFRFWTMTDLFRMWGHDVSVSSRLFFSFPRPSSRCLMQQSMVWTMGPWCQPLCSIICSTPLLATCFYFLKPLALIMFMDAVVWWDLNVSLSKQWTSAIVHNVHGHYCRPGPRCQPLWITNLCYIYSLRPILLVANLVLLCTKPTISNMGQRKYIFI
jgi:hypothetical protein